MKNGSPLNNSEMAVLIAWLNGLGSLPDDIGTRLAVHSTTGLAQITANGVPLFDSVEYSEEINAASDDDVAAGHSSRGAFRMLQDKIAADLSHAIRVVPSLSGMLNSKKMVVRELEKDKRELEKSNLVLVDEILELKRSISTMVELIPTLLRLSGGFSQLNQLHEAAGVFLSAASEVKKKESDHPKDL